MIFTAEENCASDSEHIKIPTPDNIRPNNLINPLHDLLKQIRNLNIQHFSCHQQAERHADPDFGCTGFGATAGPDEGPHALEHGDGLMDTGKCAQI